MAKILIVGDSQSVNPGAVARRQLQAHGHTVRVVSNTGRGPYDYVRMPDLWAQYTGAISSMQPDIIMLIFGHNDAPNANLRRALGELKTRVNPKVLITGPPLYADPAAQAEGQAIKAMNAAIYGVDYFDAYPFTATTLEHQAPTATFPLNPHLTLAGAQTWGMAIAAEVERKLAAPGGATRLPFGGGVSAMGVVTALLGTAALGVVVAMMMRRR
jgi:lysophospholipase L1-like esterase